MSRARPGTPGYTPRLRGHVFYGGPDPRCECGAEPPAGTKQREARVWHRAHKAEVRGS